MAEIDQKISEMLNTRNQQEVERLNRNRDSFPRLHFHQKVWFKRPEGSGSKLDTRWIGPARVVKQKGTNSDKVQFDEVKFIEVPAKFPRFTTRKWELGIGHPCSGTSGMNWRIKVQGGSMCKVAQGARLHRCTKVARGHKVHGCTVHGLAARKGALSMGKEGLAWFSQWISNGLGSQWIWFSGFAFLFLFLRPGTVSLSLHCIFNHRGVRTFIPEFRCLFSGPRSSKDF